MGTSCRRMGQTDKCTTIRLRMSLSHPDIGMISPSNSPHSAALGLHPLSPCRTRAMPMASHTPLNRGRSKKNLTSSTAPPPPHRFPRLIRMIPSLSESYPSAPLRAAYCQNSPPSIIVGAAVPARAPLAAARLYPVYSKYLRKTKPKPIPQHITFFSLWLLIRKSYA